ncbi:MAG TPA: regulatory protein RecX [Solirubrobacteraceae bacterium]|nr:regulatory protein RecX [Solirubrobacteraceae bacterium]
MESATEEQALQRAIDLACAHINRRERTVAEVRAQLQRKGVSDIHADEAVRTLTEQHLLDDERFAEMFVADKRQLEQWGSERIRRALGARGIDRDVVERALATSPDGSGNGGAGAGDDAELTRALALLQRRFPQPPQDRRDRDRALGILLRKGYEQELAIDALNAHARGD